jgi:carbon-monoxide dehydrogenase small subunit
VEAVAKEIEHTMATHPISLTINGQAQKGTVESRKLLVHYLRDDLGLTGTHIGCETSQCGACTIILNGNAVKSCTLFAVQADGADLMTIEGLAKDGELHPIQEGFWEEHGLQCGFCTPGMVIAIDQLLRDNPNPSEAEVRRGLDGNLCRCTGYQNIVKSALSAGRKLRGEEAFERPDATAEPAAAGALG